jgi:hypothetical protein
MTATMRKPASRRYARERRATASHTSSAGMTTPVSLQRIAAAAVAMPAASSADDFRSSRARKINSVASANVVIETSKRPEHQATASTAGGASRTRTAATSPAHRRRTQPRTTKPLRKAFVP